MRPRGLYVVDSKNLYKTADVKAKLSTIHNYVNDKLIEKAKTIAKECQLTKFTIVYVNINNITRLLYMNE